MRQRQTVQAQWIDLDFLILFLTHSANRVVFCTLYQRGTRKGALPPTTTVAADSGSPGSKS